MSRPKFALRPLLECLEDRAVPALFNVTTFQDNLTPGDGKRTLREVVKAANATPGTDAIVLPAGNYRIALDGAGEDANATARSPRTSPNRAAAYFTRGAVPST